MSDFFGPVDWQRIFVPEIALMEIFVRGTIMYLMLVGLMRVVLKRQAGGISTADVLVIVLLAEVAGNGFAAEYKSVVEGSALVATILFWTYSLEWLAHRYSFVSRILHAPTLLLIEDGKMLRKNMRTELVTVEELMAQLRENGIESCSQVKRACMEADGMISIIKMDP
jgi:uncharacterized membrane protein YcaP (DUF421 family)